MEKKNILPRHAPVAFQLTEGDDPITGMCPCGQFIEMYQPNRTFRVQSPESVDPERTNPKALWITTPTDDIGSKSLIVSRILLQNHEILKAASFERKIDKDAVILLLHKCKEQLLVCDKISKKIATDMDKIILKAQADGINTEKNGHGLNPFPYVPNLTTECSNFLREAKRIIKSICELPGLFFELSSSDNNFESLAKMLSTALEAETPLLKFITINTNHTKHIIELRNFDEHYNDQKNKKTVVENFKYTATGEITVPQWYVTGDEPRPIKEEMEAIVSYLSEITEAMFIHLVMASVKKEIPYILEKIEDSKINPDAPIKYKLSIDLAKIKMSHKHT